MRPRVAILLERYGTLRGAKKVYLDALRDTVADPERISYRDSHSDLVTAVAGTTLYPAVDTAGLDRLTRMLVGRWLAAAEQRIGRAVNGWLGDNDRQTAARYLDRLVDDGYALSEAEQQLRERLTEPDADDTDEANDDETETDDEADDPAMDPVH